MTDWVLHPHASLWLDGHYDLRAFGVLRVGATYRFAAGPSFTAGYAHAWTDPGSGGLDRNEHRPWAQLLFPLRIAAQWGFSQRIRYDLRIREAVMGGHVVDGWVAVQRVRFQAAVTYSIPRTPVFLQIADEILFNFGRNAGPNYLDQNRLSLAVGWEVDSATLRLGYMDRFVPGSSGTDVLHEHAILVWVNQKFDFLHKAETTPEASNP